MKAAAAMSSSLADFQDRFAEALLAGDGGIAVDAAVDASGFAVYRNTVMKGWVDALQANYPSVCRLVGEPFFRASAADYACTCPTSDPRLWCYGAGYADFLTRYAPAASLPYLSGVARLDRCWTEAHGAASAPALDASSLAGMTPEQLAACTLTPHPSARWAWFAGQPVYTIWRRNRTADGSEGSDALAWQGEGALLLRPGSSVEWHRLGIAGCTFMDACANAQPLGLAAAAAMDADPQADIASLLAMLLQAGAFKSPGP